MSQQQKPYHKTVLLSEAIDNLSLKPGKTYLDATFGGGGHTRAILEAEPTCHVVAFDWDQNAIEINAPALIKEFGERLTIIWGNFAHCYRLLRKEGISEIDGVLADFGTSQHQIFHQDGFSFTHDTPLDMRMSKSHHYFTASYVVNKFTHKHLTDIIGTLGEERHARAIAQAIVDNRGNTPLETTKQLADLILKTIPFTSHSRIHPATKTFQALRIFVNKELENIEQFLRDILPFLHKGGRIACISFHSLEDRIVKNFFRDQHGILTPITRKPITPNDAEIATNNASRSAKLRVAEKYIDKIA